MAFFSRTEIRTGLLGCFETALLMRSGPKRFGNTRDEAMRSFLLPALLFPASILLFFLSGMPGEIGATNNTILILMSLRAVAIWVLFFGTIAWVLRHVNHMDHFYRFVIASNWLSVPALIMFMPVFYLVMGGTYSWDEVYPLTMILTLVLYFLGAYVAVYALVIPWEMALFFTMIAMVINDGTLNMVTWLGHVLSA